MAKLTIADAEKIAAKGRPWTFRLEYRGSNPANQSGVSNKYWYATGRGLTEAVETGWGAIGSVPQHKLTDWPTLRDKVAEKLTEGYMYADTPFVRMSASALALLGGANPSAVPAGVPTAAKPAAVSAPLVVAAGTVLTPGVVVQRITATSNKAPSAAQVALGEPFSLICALRLVREGGTTTVKGYQALDEQGNEVLMFPPAEGIQFAQTYDIDVTFA